MILVADGPWPRRGRAAALAAFLVLALAACERGAEIHTLSGPTMGTSWSVKVVGLPTGVARSALRSKIESLLESVNNQMSTWQSDSVISKYNEADAGSWISLPPDFFQVLEYALSVARKTGGAYDPTVGPLVKLWGFGPGRTGTFERPTEAAIARTRERIGWQKVELKPEERAVLQPGGIQLDLSSVAKGYAVDKVAEFLDARGVGAYLVEIGGELRARGTKPGGKPWRVAVEKPRRDPGRSVQQVVALRDRAMATSGDYRNFHRGADGTLYSHTIDPRTGRPVEHHLASVTVVTSHCMNADALATALNVLGPDEGMAFARQRDLAVLMLIRGKDGLRARATEEYRQLREATRN